MAGTTTLISTVGQQILYVLGILMFLLLFLHLVGDKLPIVSRWIGEWNMGQGFRHLNARRIILIHDDGYWSLAPAEYDRENNGYWANLPDSPEFFNAEGVDQEGNFYGVPAVAAYRGLGSYEDRADGELEIEGKVVEEIPADAPQPGLVGRVAGAVAGVTDSIGIGRSDAGTDDSAEQRREHSLGMKAIIDLRDTLYNAPFHVRPSAFHRVEKNAQKDPVGVFGGLGALGQAAIIIGAVLVGGLMVWFVMGGGGGGGSASLPFLLDL